MKNSKAKMPLYIGMAVAVIFIAAIAIFLSKCTTDNFIIPKPIAFFRIEPYDTTYTAFTGLPLNIEVNSSAIPKFSNDSSNISNNKWINIYYPRYDATIYCSYIPITPSTLQKHINNRMERISRNANTEVPRNVVFEDLSRHMSASLFFTSAESISPLQFIATDSVNYMFSGAVYFTNKVKSDSISPVIDYLTDDVIHMLQNLKINR